MEGEQIIDYIFLGFTFLTCLYIVVYAIFQLRQIGVLQQKITTGFDSQMKLISYVYFIFIIILIAISVVIALL